MAWIDALVVFISSAHPRLVIVETQSRVEIESSYLVCGEEAALQVLPHCGAMAPCSRWGWFLIVALVLLLTLVPSVEGHRSKKRPQQPPQAPPQAPAPVPAPSIVPVPPPVVPPPAPVPPPSPAPPPTPPTKPSTKPSTTPPRKPTASPTTKPLPRPAPVAPAPKPKPAPPASKPQPVPPKPKPDFTDEEINNGTALAKLNLRALKNARTMNTPQTHLGDNNPCQGANVPMRKEW